MVPPAYYEPPNWDKDSADSVHADDGIHGVLGEPFGTTIANAHRKKYNSQK